MKNILLRLVYALSWMVFIPIEILWIVIMVCPITFGLFVLWIVTGTDKLDDYYFMLMSCPTLIPIKLKENLEKRGVI
jgi:hypothetical protein